MTLSRRSQIAVLGTHTPRQCGIATFTADVANSVAEAGHEVDVIAFEDESGAYSYPERVKLAIPQQDIAAYLTAAGWIKNRGYDALLVQHEFGIFGGPEGSHLLALLRNVSCPVIATLHTILSSPSPGQRAVIEGLACACHKLVCMTKRGADILQEIYGVPASQIAVIPHGIPLVAPQAQDGAKEALGFGKRKVLLTFGLISPDKGLEDVVRAMPEIVAEHPDVLYLVAGATHPHVRQSYGEAYRESLINLAESLGVANAVHFENRFLSLAEITQRLHACDVYITPYLKKEQITSGALAYAYGCGNAVVSTPYWHASELLAEGRGILVPHSCPEAIAFEVSNLLNHPDRLRDIQQAALANGKSMEWPAVGRRYADILGEAVRATAPRPSSTKSPQLVETRVDTSIPGLEHLLSLTDEVGVMQHAKYAIPNRSEGYCLDDCARGALVFARLRQHPRESSRIVLPLSRTLAFIGHAFDPDGEAFSNFMDYDRRWSDKPRSGDATGRAVWTLGVLAGDRRPSNEQEFARDLLSSARVAIAKVPSLRGRATTVIGLVAAARGGFDHLDAIRREYAETIRHEWEDRAIESWRWLEDGLLYDNAHIPHALIASGSLDNDDEALGMGLDGLAWLLELQTSPTGHFRPVGSEGFNNQGKATAVFDQQPIEVWTTVEACAAAYLATGQDSWLHEAQRVHGWFFGRNDLGVQLCDPVTGGAYDGLTAVGPNRNQGAEAAISLVGSRTAIDMALAIWRSQTNGMRSEVIDVA